MQSFETKALPENFDYLAPDGSEIRLLSEMVGGGLAHCMLPAGKASSAVMHRAVEEIWYFIQGQGEVWRKSDDQEMVTNVESGISLTIPPGAHFQFRNTCREPLIFLIVTMPPWPGVDEAISVDNHWKDADADGG